MPYIVEMDEKACPVSKPWAVKNQQTGDLRGCHPSKEMAQQQQKALYANVPDATQKKSEEVTEIGVRADRIPGEDDMTASTSNGNSDTLAKAVSMPRKSLIRSAPFELSMPSPGASSDGRLATMSINFARFNEPTEIDSWIEGRFIEKIDNGSFSKTFQDRGEQIKVLFNHGKDTYICDKVLGPIENLREEADGAWADVPLIDTSYNRDLLPALKAGLYGASFRMQVLREDVNQTPERSAENPDGIPERTIKEIKLHEFGPVTFPAYAGATASARSLTDRFFLDEASRANSPVAALRVMIAQARQYMDAEQDPEDQRKMQAVLDSLNTLLKKDEGEGEKSAELSSDDEVRAVWTTAYMNNLPDSAFLYIESGGSKDSEGKTTPRSLRHFPYKDSSGNVDFPHLRNALSRIPQSSLSQSVKDEATAKAKRLLGENKSAEDTEAAESRSAPSKEDAAAEPRRNKASNAPLYSERRSKKAKRTPLRGTNKENWRL